MFEPVNDLTIPYKITTANTFFQRLKGLMFRKAPLVGEGLWIIPCNSIHMCFMKFPIDVVFLCKNVQVVKLVRGIKPWRFVAPVKGTHSALELPEGAIDELKLQLGQKIKIENGSPITSSHKC